MTSMSLAALAVSTFSMSGPLNSRQCCGEGGVALFKRRDVRRRLGDVLRR